MMRLPAADASTGDVEAAQGVGLVEFDLVDGGGAGQVRAGRGVRGDVDPEIASLGAGGEGAGAQTADEARSAR
jgi:hypothetical protein